MLLRTRDGLRFPINGKVGDLIASLCLIPVIFEGWTKQVYSIACLALQESGCINISCIYSVLIWQEVLLSQVSMNLGESLFIRQRGRSSFNMSNQLWSIFVARLGEVNLVANPQGSSFFFRNERPDHTES